VCGWQVKLRDPLVTHGPYLSALEVQHDEALYTFTFTLLLWGPLFVGGPVRPKMLNMPFDKCVKVVIRVLYRCSLLCSKQHIGSSDCDIQYNIYVIDNNT